MNAKVRESDSIDQPMSRRRFGGVLGAFFVAASQLTIAQGPTAVRRIGTLDVGEAPTPEEIRKAGEPLRKLGWLEGQNLHVERRYANGRAETLQALAGELVRANVEIIVTSGTTATLAAKGATTSIPIVFAVADPVLMGLVASLVRPGGNLTGYSQARLETAAKYLSLLKQLIPALSRVGVLEYSVNPYYRAARRQYEDICRSLRLDAVFVEIAEVNEIEHAIAQLPRQRVQALVLRADTFVADNRLEISKAALKQRLPTMAEEPELVRKAGILASYSAVAGEDRRRVAGFIDRILRGAKPADLPVELPVQFDLLFNLKTARALGLTIPESLLLQASEVIR